MNDMTNYITERPWADTITIWYILVDDAYNRLIVRRGKPLRAPQWIRAQVLGQ